MKALNRFIAIGFRVVFALTIPVAASAANIVVTSLADTQANDGACALREALINANTDSIIGSPDCAAGSGPDTITFSATGTITLTSVLPTITSVVTIHGASTTISGGSPIPVTSGLLAISAGASLTVRNLTLINSVGGAIRNDGTLLVDNSIFFNNSANVGGAIYNSGTATLMYSTFSKNAASFGAGIGNTGTLIVANSTFSNNSANASAMGNGTGGGAIYNTSQATITNSTFSGNIGGQEMGGGGIWNACGTLTVRSSTFVNNVATSSTSVGGGILNGQLNDPCTASAGIGSSTFFGNSAVTGGAIYNLGTTSVLGSTIAGNRAGTAFGGAGGGIYNGSKLGIPGTINLRLTIIAGNTVATPTVPSHLENCAGVLPAEVNSAAYNLEDASTCGFSPSNRSKPNTDPFLDPAGLKNNGGATKTIALCTGIDVPTAGCPGASPAIDAGDLLTCIRLVNVVDQRGFRHLIDGDGLGGFDCDIGAFEAKSPLPSVINTAVTFAPLPSTFQTTADVTGCPAGFAGQLSFLARFEVKSLSGTGIVGFAGLMARVVTLTNGNLLLNADGGAAGTGATLTLPRLDSVGPSDVPFHICLQRMDPFTFLIDVLGTGFD